MYRTHLTLLIACAVLCSGCHTPPRLASFIEHRNAEARQLEDEYWLQVQENERLAFELAKLKRARTRTSDGMGPPLIEEGPSLPRVEPGTEPLIEMPDTPSTPPRERPQIDPEPAPRPGGTDKVNPSRARPGELPPRREYETGPTGPGVIDEKVTHLFLNPLHTGGIDLDQRPGDDGLSLLLEPRNAADQFIPREGNISVVLLDPAQSGDAARIARWNFDAAEAKQAISQDQDARGIRLEMPWPSRAPEHDQLRLFVRFETADGRKIQVEREVFVRLAGQLSERWTPRPPERQRRNEPVHSAVVQSSPAAAASPAARGRESFSDNDSQLAGPDGRNRLPTPSTPSAASPPALLTPPPALSEAPGEVPARPTWKPYR